MVKATGRSVRIRLPKTARLPETELEWRFRAGPHPGAQPARAPTSRRTRPAALYFVERGRAESTRAHPDLVRFKVPGGDQLRFHEAVRACSRTHGQSARGRSRTTTPIATRDASGRDARECRAPYEEADPEHPLFEENGRSIQRVRIMPTVRSFDPCLPCGVHMYLAAARCASAPPADSDTADG